MSEGDAWRWPVRTGKLPAQPHRLVRSPQLSAHTFGVMAPPEKVDRRDIDYQPLMFDNDTFGDCTAANTINYARGVAALNGYQLVVEPDAALRFFAKCMGVSFDDKAALAACDGADVLAVMGKQLATGIDLGPQTIFADWGTIANDRAQLATGINAFGGIGVGVALYERDMEMPPIWDDDGRDPGALVAYHWMHAWDCPDGLGDTQEVRCGTWARFQPATWRWVHSRMDEAHGLMWRQLLRTDGTNWAGVDYARLRADCMQFAMSE